MSAGRRDLPTLRLMPPARPSQAARRGKVTKPSKPQPSRSRPARPARRKRKPVPESQKPDITTTPKLLLSMQEAAYALGCGKSKLYDLIEAGEVVSFKVGSVRRVTLASLECYVERMQAGAAGAAQASQAANSLQA